MKVFLFLLALCLSGLSCYAVTDHFVTPAGAGSHNGSSSGNAWSASELGSQFSIPGDDRVFATGNFTGTQTLGLYSSGASGHPILLDCTGATFATDNSHYDIELGGSYINAVGGGSDSGGSGHLKIHTTVSTITAPLNEGTYPHNCLIHCSDTTTGNTIDGFTFLSGGAQNPVTGAGANSCAILSRDGLNLTIQNNYNNAQIIGLANTDYGPPSGWVIQNNFWVTAYNIFEQCDILALGDIKDLTVQGNYFLMTCTGNNPNGRHNDILQCYESGASNHAPPSGWIVRYNWFELNCPLYGPNQNAGTFVLHENYTIVTAGTTSWTSIGAANNNVGTVFTATGGGSGTGVAKMTGTGDTSQLQMEGMSNAGSGFAGKIYANIFVGIAGTDSNNGSDVYDYAASTYYNYHNTYITVGGAPGNSVRFMDVNSTGLDHLYARNNVGYDTTGHGGTAILWQPVAGAAWKNWFYNWGTQTAAKGTGSDSIDPLLNNVASAQYWLGASSPLLGVADNTIGVEYANGIAPNATWPNPSLNARPTGGPWDPGAYQSATGTPATPTNYRKPRTLAGGMF